MTHKSFAASGSVRISYLLPFAFLLLLCIFAVSDLRTLICDWGFLCVLLSLSISDCRTRRIPNTCIAAGIGIRILSVTIFGQPVRSFLFGIAAGGIAAICLLIISYLFFRYTGTVGTGAGDIKLIFTAGLFLGPVRTLYTLFLSGVFALLVRMLRFTHLKKERAFPFGPYISAATAVMLLFGTDLLNFL